MDVRKILKYQISWKSVQREPCCSMRTDGRADMTMLIVAFRSFANAPNTNWIIIGYVRVLLEIQNSRSTYSETKSYLERNLHSRHDISWAQFFTPEKQER
jgi:hypothetical protein